MKSWAVNRYLNNHRKKEQHQKVQHNLKQEPRRLRSVPSSCGNCGRWGRRRTRHLDKQWLRCMEKTGNQPAHWQQLYAADSVFDAGNELSSWLPARQIKTVMKMNRTTNTHISIRAVTHPHTLFQTDLRLLACTQQSSCQAYWIITEMWFSY